MKFICCLFILILLLVGCSRTEEIAPVLLTSTPIPILLPTFTPIPLPTATLVPTKVVDERADVIESLILFNNINDDFIRFMESNEDIYQLDGNPFHVSFVASKQVVFALMIYRGGIDNWIPSDNSYYDRLMEIKEAELYRIQFFSELIETMLITLQTENEEDVQVVLDKFLEWRTNPINQKPTILQNYLLKELNINPDTVNFKYVFSLEELQELEEGLNDSLFPNIPHGNL